MAASANTPTSDTGEPTQRVFRRQSSVIGGCIFAGALIALGIALTPGEIGHGFLPALAPLCTTLPLALLVLIFLAAPRVVVRKETLDIHNSFVSYEIPYPAIDEIRQTRMGLLVKTVAGKSIPATAYASGSGGRVLKHTEHADEVIVAAKNNMEFKKATGGDLPAVRRHANLQNTIALLAAVAIALAVTVGAAHTYH